MRQELQYGQRFADSIGAVWEIVDFLPYERVKLWNRSYNAFQTVFVEKLKEMRPA